MSATLLPSPELTRPGVVQDTPLIRPFASIRRADVPTVGGKGANLGEMVAAGLPVPPGFVLAIEAYRRFYVANELGPIVGAELATLNADDPTALDRASARLRASIADGEVPDDMLHEILTAYRSLVGTGPAVGRVAVRSSATAEDTAQFSFAGMFESFLNVTGEDGLIEAVKACWASTFSARVLFYRVKQGLPLEMPVAVVVQAMVNSEKSGVMFTCDPATHDLSRMVIEAAWGLGESVVQGAVTPDRHVVDKQSLSVVATTISAKEFLLTWDSAAKRTARVDLAGDARSTAPVLTPHELSVLAGLARRAEKHYGAPQDMEFAIEGTNIMLTQSRPITTLGAAAAIDEAAPATSQEPVVRGLGASPGTATGKVRVLSAPSEESAMQNGEILVTRMTSPDWVPIMRRAAAIVTDSGGMTSHAAIVARELGLPCIVGAHDATRVLHTGTVVT
ncbi:MAG: PEP/pyruvate-binding domain-containing protein, partial [Gemmatimonadaceae bacterium]